MAVFKMMFHKPEQVDNTDSNTNPEEDEELIDNSETTPQNASNVPSLPQPLVKKIPKIYKERLVPIDLRFGIVREVKDARMPLMEAHEKVLRERQFAGTAKASVCFVIRKPGCVICHEQGQVLSELISSFPENRVAAWAVIKEINVDNDGLLKMYQKHFHFPFFMDSKMKLYKALGNRKLNPFKTFRIAKETKARIRSRKIQGSAFGPGEGLTLGGILIFDTQGQIRYAFHEKSGGQEFPFDQIRVAIEDVMSSSGVRQT